MTPQSRTRMDHNHRAPSPPAATSSHASIPFSLGLQTGEKFRITFDYYAHGRLYSNEFQSPTAIAQNEQIALLYNPLNPEQNSLSAHSNAASRGPLLAIGIVGSITLSLLWLAILRGCS